MSHHKTNKIPAQIKSTLSNRPAATYPTKTNLPRPSTSQIHQQPGALGPRARLLAHPLELAGPAVRVAAVVVDRLQHHDVVVAVRGRRRGRDGGGLLAQHARVVPQLLLFPLGDPTLDEDVGGVLGSGLVYTSSLSLGFGSESGGNVQKRRAQSRA